MLPALLHFELLTQVEFRLGRLWYGFAVGRGLVHVIRHLIGLYLHRLFLRLPLWAILARIKLEHHGCCGSYTMFSISSVSRNVGPGPLRCEVRVANDF